jgi:hypothetical protein
LGVNRRTVRPRTARVRMATLGALAVAVVCAQLIVVAPLGSTPLTGGFSPTIVAGKADLNGNGAVTGRDDANDGRGRDRCAGGPGARHASELLNPQGEHAMRLGTGSLAGAGSLLGRVLARR